MRRHPGENKCIVVVAVLFLTTGQITRRATRNEVVFLAPVTLILVLLFLAIFVLLIIGVYLER